MISADLRFEGFDSRSWTHLVSLFTPNVVTLRLFSPNVFMLSILSCSLIGGIFIRRKIFTLRLNILGICCGRFLFSSISIFRLILSVRISIDGRLLLVRGLTRWFFRLNVVFFLLLVIESLRHIVKRLVQNFKYKISKMIQLRRGSVG